jgi:hypothetical protein
MSTPAKVDFSPLGEQAVCVLQPRVTQVVVAGGPVVTGRPAPDAMCGKRVPEVLKDAVRLGPLSDVLTHGPREGRPGRGAPP